MLGSRVVLVLSLLCAATPALRAQETRRATETGAAIGGIAGLLVGAVSAATERPVNVPACAPWGCGVRNMSFIAHADRIVVGAFIGAAAGALIGSRISVPVGRRNTLEAGITTDPSGRPGVGASLSF